MDYDFSTQILLVVLLLWIKMFFTSVGELTDMSAVAAEKFWVRCPKWAPMPDHHKFHLTLVNVDQHSGASLCVHEEDNGEDGHLKLGARPNESTANGLNQTMPAKLEVEDVVILIRLWIKHRTVR